jgi:hypothetical protein
MSNVSIRECFSVLNMSIVCIRNTARSKSIPLLCTHVDPYKFSTVHPPRCHLHMNLNNMWSLPIARLQSNLDSQVGKSLQNLDACNMEGVVSTHIREQPPSRGLQILCTSASEGLQLIPMRNENALLSLWQGPIPFLLFSLC